MRRPAVHGTQMSDPASKLPPEVWVVVPAYNEGPRLGQALDGLLQVAQSVVVVDDGSQDDTYQVAATRPVWVLRHVVNLGQGAALQTGIVFALRQGAQYVATFDGDGQHSPADLLLLFRTLQDRKANIVFGSRFLGRALGMPRHRTIMLQIARFAAYALCGVWVTDVTTGLRLLDRRAAKSIQITMNRFEHPVDILQQIRKKGLVYAECPATITYTPESLRKGQRTLSALRLGAKIIAERLTR